ncbi:MAG: BamA/TamA family outer membrane protein [Bacteroidales bacterium]|nr:BamA/TamA family outer membrane protein [Bacteroidales bacterium]
MFKPLFLIFLTASIFLISCYPTRFVPDNEYLLKRNKIVIHNKYIDKYELESYIRPKVNRKILWTIPFHLYVYNLSRIGKERKWKTKLGNVIGEPPVIVNKIDIIKSKEQIKLYLKTKGYYNASVDDSLHILSPKKAEVIYYINSRKPFIIDSVNFETKDPIIANYLFESKNQSYIKKGNFLDEEVLQLERNRITMLLKNLGYYYFTKDFVFFNVDTTLGDKKVLITTVIINNINNDIETPHQKYVIDSVFVFHNYNPKQALQNKSQYFSQLDTIEYKNIILIGTDKPMYKPALLERMNFIKPHQYYNQKDAEITYNKYISLNNFRLVNIHFIESGRRTGLNCNIELTPLQKQFYQIEAEGTNSSGNLGVAGNLIYNNRNLFGGAQKLNIRLHGSIERQTAVIQQNDEQIQTYLPFNSLETSLESKLQFPSFVFPFISEKFIKYNNPITQVQGSYSFQQRPDYTRTISTLTFGYEWNGNKNLKHFVNPIELNYVQIPFISWRFNRLIRGTFLESSYLNHMETISSYGFLFNDPKVGKNKQNTIFIRGKFETSGNLLYTYFHEIKKQIQDTSYQLFSVPFSQFVRAEMDLRYYKFIGKNTKIVYRLYGGAGYPYGNSSVLPFNKQYFSGGASSIRAWAVRSLGPGSVNDTTYQGVYNQTADVKLEGNLEYRFKLFWVIEPALFVDVGNIWDIYKKENRENGVFKLDKFYNDLAIGYGIGLRFNFGFFIFRSDFSLKGKDPAESIGNRWLFIQRKHVRDDFTINIGIGYPF